MEFVLNEYLPLAIFLVISVVISCLFVLANFLIAVHNPDPEKNSAYECGFEQLGDSRMKFDVRFYLVTIRPHRCRIFGSKFENHGGRIYYLVETSY